MIKGGKGGGNTITGLHFEEKVNLLELFKKTPGYFVDGKAIFYEGKEVARSYQKHDLYKYLKSRNLDYRTILSKKWLPDEAIYVLGNNTLYIIEIKFQHGSGSVDEKLQTCDFKKKHYTKLLAPLEIKVEYIYVLNDWFKDPKYKDTLNYVISVGCRYYFDVLPFKVLGLPTPKI